MRNRRKIVIIDNRITYCGSQNCTDPAFIVKVDYAPWVDIMLRFARAYHTTTNISLLVTEWPRARKT